MECVEYLKVSSTKTFTKPSGSSPQDTGKDHHAPRVLHMTTVEHKDP